MLFTLMMTANSITVTDVKELSKIDYGKRVYKKKTKLILGSLAAFIFVIALTGYLVHKKDWQGTERLIEKPVAIDSSTPPPSKLRVFKKAAVCTDAPRCSDVGNSILLKNGSAVDAAIASMLCNGVINHQSMGLGGGFFMTVYIKEEKKAYTVIAREKAPMKTTVNMFDGDNHRSSEGPLAAAVPGELRGMWAAYQRWGKLPWADLVKPTIDICRNGFLMSPVLYDSLQVADKKNNIKRDVHLRQMYVNMWGDFHEPGTLIMPSRALCRTFERIAKNGGDELYNGTLAMDFLDDLQSIGGIITAEDLANYNAKIVEPLKVPLGNGEFLYSPPPPGSGTILASVLNILSGYRFNSSSIATTEAKILTYHRIIEAFKHAYATRSKLADPDFMDVQELVNNVTSTEYGAQIRLRINDDFTSNSSATYGVMEYNPPDGGTAHMSIMAGNGDAVAVTSSINYYFGAGFTTFKTGIVLNNIMDDFSSPGVTNFYSVKPSRANLIAPGKRPLSSMCPSVIVDKDGNAKLVIGASGGTRITTSVALVTIRKLWFDQTIKEAVDAPRIHHQVLPMTADYQLGVMEDVIEGLRAKGHGLNLFPGRGSVVCALYRNSTAIYGNSDFRKGGDVAGLD